MYNNKNKYDTGGGERCKLLRTAMHAFTVRLMKQASYSYLVLLRFIWRVSLSGYVINVTADSTYQPSKLHSTRTKQAAMMIPNPFQFLFFHTEAGKNAPLHKQLPARFFFPSFYHFKIESWNSLGRRMVEHEFFCAIFLDWSFLFLKRDWTMTKLWT